MAHIHEKIDFVSNVYIVNGDAVLLRKHDKSGTWLPPGGHIELDEEPAEAALREVKEEVGMEVELLSASPDVIQSTDYLKTGGRNLITPFFMNRHRINDTHEHISFEFFAISKTRNFSQGKTELSEDIRWYTRKDLDDSTTEIPETIRYYAKAALEAATK